MSKFQPLAFYRQPVASGYQLLPFNFTPLDKLDYVATNVAGEHVVLSRDKLEALVQHRLPHDDPLYNDLKSKHFLSDPDSTVANDLLALKVRTKLQFLQDFTSLHIVVVTLRCEHSCHYCQVSRQSEDRAAYDMPEATAILAVQTIFRSPSRHIKIEFQGGEPLLNFARIQQIVLLAEHINQTERRDLQFVIATNLALLTDEVLAFCKQHSILISTSLDGPEALHNKNRPRPGKNSYEKTLDGVRRTRAVLGHDRVSALMTTTRASLPVVREIIDEYVSNQFEGIFLRPLSPYGFAIKTKSFAAYDRDAWLKFYKDGLDHIIAINKAGTRFVEYYSAIILSKILTPFTPGYVDLVSPSGIGLGALVYNYDGDVYASDESRMLAEMGDKTFRLGNLHADSYERIIYNDTLLEALEQSFAQSSPMCNECAFEPYCGADPVYHYATQRDFVGKKPLSDFCARHMAMCRHLISLMRDSPDTKEIFLRWVC